MRPSVHVAVATALASATLIAAAPLQRPLPAWTSDGVMLAHACEPTPYGLQLASELGPGKGTASIKRSPLALPLLLARVDAAPDDPIAHLDAGRCYIALEEGALAREQLTRAMDVIARLEERSPAPVADPKPVKKSGAAPELPQKALAQGVTGVVFVDATVDATGAVRDAHVVGSVPQLDAFALRAAKSWKFTPAIVNGQAQPSVTTLVFKFGALGGQDHTDGVDIARFLVGRRSYREAADVLAQTIHAVDFDIMVHRSAEDRKADANAHGGVIQPGWWGAGAYVADGLATKPSPTRRPTPLYTREAMGVKVMGTVELDVLILSDGTVGDAVVTRSLDRRFGMDDAALAAARAWRFKPARDASGTAVPVVVTLIFDLRLH